MCVNDKNSEFTCETSSTKDLVVQPISPEDRQAFAECFVGESSVASRPLQTIVRDRILPSIAHTMGWTSGAQCRKLRANNVTAVTARYNSDFHRDRHLFGTAGIDVRRVEAWTNLSAVIYLDAASFEYLEGSAWGPPPTDKQQRRQTFAPGTMIIFPSCLVHKASENPALQTARRTIVVFDIEQVNVTTKIPHAIVCMPASFRMPVNHWVLGKEWVQTYALYCLFSDSMYWWRFIPRWCRQVGRCRVHWQITTLPDKNAATGGGTTMSDEGLSDQGIVLLNSSIYMFNDNDKQQQQQQTKDGDDNHVFFYDYRSQLEYWLRLLDAYTLHWYETR